MGHINSASPRLFSRTSTHETRATTSAVSNENHRRDYSRDIHGEHQVPGGPLDREPPATNHGPQQRDLDAPARVGYRFSPATSRARRRFASATSG